VGKVFTNLYARGEERIINGQIGYLGREVSLQIAAMATCWREGKDYKFLPWQPREKRGL
jgi:hypothetical protein